MEDYIELLKEEYKKYKESRENLFDDCRILTFEEFCDGRGVLFPEEDLEDEENE